MGRPKKLHTETEGAIYPTVDIEIQGEPIEDSLIKPVERDETSPENKIPLMTDPEWSDYVMEHFVDSEKFKDNPKVDGLRRVTELLLGEIISSESRVIQTAELSNDNRVTVEHHLTIRTDTGDKHFSDAADVYPGNCDAFYSIYPTALACTRAEGRALRKALRLRCVAAEEISDEAPTITANKEIKIKDFQINAIDTACKRCDINVQSMLKNSQFGPFANIYEVPYNVAARLIVSLNQFQQNPSKISPNIKGYRADWREQ